MFFHLLNGNLGLACVVAETLKTPEEPSDAAVGSISKKDGCSCQDPPQLPPHPPLLSQHQTHHDLPASLLFQATLGKETPLGTGWDVHTLGTQVC